MKHFKMILVILMTLGLCGSIAACSSPSGNTGDNTAKTEAAAEESKEEEKTETEAEAEEDTAGTPNIGIIASTMDRAAARDFVTAVQMTLEEQYPDQIGEILLMDAHGDKAMLLNLLSNCRARWDGDHNVIVIVNDETGFSDDVLFAFLENADGLGITAGLDRTIDGAPESSFVYDASDAAGCASMIMENTKK